MDLRILADFQPVTHTVDAVLAPHIYVFYASFIVAFIFTPVMRAVALHFGILDMPDRLRKAHSSPVAYLGGVAVFLGWLAGLAFSQFHIGALDDSTPYPHVTVSIVIGAMVIVLLGLWDDIKRLKPSAKIAGQLLAALILMAGHIGTHCLDPLITPLDVRLEMLHKSPVPEPLVVAASTVVVICLVVGCCNATNLMDGLDGLCGGVTAVMAAGFLFLAVHLATVGADPDWDSVRVILALALLGGVFGFIPYNFNPASIFMGDTGSMFLGFACATMILLLGEQQSRWFLAALVMFSLPVLDTALAFARRYVNRRPLFSADRHHFHHQMVARGYSVRKTVLISYAVAFYLVTFGSIIVAAYKMGMVHEKPRIVSAGTVSRASMKSVETDLEPAGVMEIRDEPDSSNENDSLH
jgi:UDP-GlcNAc:undecaprenyl-phosphate/decaprenyl-phosphate GlcNAc-1-phosphate transferase